MSRHFLVSVLSNPRQVRHLSKRKCGLDHRARQRRGWRCPSHPCPRRQPRLLLRSRIYRRSIGGHEWVAHCVQRHIGPRGWPGGQTVSSSPIHAACPSLGEDLPEW